MNFIKRFLEGRSVFIWRRRFIMLAIFFAFFLFIFGVNLYINLQAKGKIFREASEIPSLNDGERYVALVLGAKVDENGNLSDVLHDRLDAIQDIYYGKDDLNKEGKVRKVIASGDNGSESYDEVNAMRDYLLEIHIPPRDIFTDYAGFDTYDSIYRAKEIFGVEKMIIVSQEFHLPRALFIAKSLGIEALGFSANFHTYKGNELMQLREVFANVKAFGNVLLNSKPKFLGEKIDISGDGRKSWDIPTQ